MLGYRTASVIIALTDGELRENEFDLAAREVRPYTLDPATFSIISPQSMKKIYLAPTAFSPDFTREAAAIIK